MSPASTPPLHHAWFLWRSQLMSSENSCNIDRSFPHLAVLSTVLSFLFLPISVLSLVWHRPNWTAILFLPWAHTKVLPWKSSRSAFWNTSLLTTSLNSSAYLWSGFRVSMIIWLQNNACLSAHGSTSVALLEPLEERLFVQSSHLVAVSFKACIHKSFFCCP